MQICLPKAPDVESLYMSPRKDPESAKRQRRPLGDITNTPHKRERWNVVAPKKQQQPTPQPVARTINFEDIREEPSRVEFSKKLTIDVTDAAVREALPTPWASALARVTPSADTQWAVSFMGVATIGVLEARNRQLLVLQPAPPTIEGVLVGAAFW